MSKYTVQYGTIYDSGFSDLRAALAGYPIFDETHRAALNQKIYDRYRFREIAFETAAMFAHYFKTLLNEIMPYYNELYATAAREYDFLTDADLTESEDISTNSSSNGTASASTNATTQAAGTGKETRAHSDTPQGSFNFSDVTGNQYLSDAEIAQSESADSTNATTQSASNSTMQGAGQSARTKHITGKSPGRSYAEMIREYRETVLNIDVLILDELNVCFMGIY